MFMNILVLLFVLGIAYAWMVRGVFNAMIHAMCVVFAGALAFALWEPLSMLLINVSPNTGLVSALGDAAWGIGQARAAPGSHVHDARPHGHGRIHDRGLEPVEVACDLCPVGFHFAAGVYRIGGQTLGPTQE